jgi:hypothetical protein
MITPKIIYLKNVDLMSEIHLSKNTYCSYILPEYANYDFILENINDVQYNIDEAKKNRATRVNLPIEEILKTDLIFRIMDHSHIPFAKHRRKGTTGKIRVNFPPFQHYKYNNIGQLVCVGKSHWIGDLENGEFSYTHGRITETLGAMFITLVNKYSTKGNVREYSYNDEMRSNAIAQLVQSGLQFNEFKSQYAFAYVTKIVINAFTCVINTEKKMQSMRDDILEMNNMSPSFTRQTEWSDEQVNSSE